MTNKPDFKTVPEYYHQYINLVAEDDLTTALEKQLLSTMLFLKTIPEEIGNFRYAENKWSAKEVLLHIMDTERIFTYRSLCISRNDKTNFPSFDENNYAPNSNAANRTMEEIILEYEALRRSTILLFRGFSPSMMDETGTANNFSITPRGIGWVIAGHELHHLNVIKERYLS